MQLESPFHRPALRPFFALALAIGLWPSVEAADDAAITAFSAAAPGDPPAAWKFATLPNKVATKYSVVELGGERVLKVEADESYGNLVHSIRVPVTERSTLSWRWRVDKLAEDADIRIRSGEDSAAKLCVFFDFDSAKLSFGERAKLALARNSTGEDVPTESLCYVWDNKLPIETSLTSSFTKRIRFIVLQSGTGKRGQWTSQRRNLAADYQRAFGEESEGKLPAVTGVSVSADTDNTHGHGLSYFGDITLSP